MVFLSNPNTQKGLVRFQQMNGRRRVGGQGSGVIRVGVISDTHGYFNPHLPAVFKGVSVILHAGDIGRLDVIRRLETIAPVEAVRGNMDVGLCSLPQWRLVQVDQVAMLVTHLGTWEEDMAIWLWERHGLKQPEVFVYGHSHRAVQHWEGGMLHFNPGAAGRARFGKQPSVGILSVQGRTVTGQIVSLRLP